MDSKMFVYYFVIVGTMCPLMDISVQPTINAAFLQSTQVCYCYCFHI